MKNKRGFTLLELLTTIVILTVIALIAIPIILNIINKARLRAFVNTGYGILKATENYRISELLNDNNTGDVSVSFDDYKNQLSFKGTKPDGGNVTVKTTGRSSLALWSESLKRCIVKGYDTNKITLLDEEYDKSDCTAGVLGSGNIESGTVWDGWIKLTLYYPEDSTERMWRLNSRGNIRTEGQESWQNYEGSITIPLSRVEDVFIKYKMPDGTVVISTNDPYVDIEPSKYVYSTGDKINVKLNYSKENLKSVQYMVGNGSWTDYKKPFTVEKSTTISARLKKTENVYASDGSLLTTKTTTVYDSVYIRKSGENVITENCDDTNSCPVTSGPSGGGGYPPAGGGGNPPGGNPPYYDELKGPNLVLNNNNLTCDAVTATITTNYAAKEIYYRIGNGKYIKYTAPFSISSNTSVSTYYIKDDGEGTISLVSNYRIINIKDCSGTDEGNPPYLNIDANPYPYINNALSKNVRVGISYDSSATKVEYSLDGVNYKEYKNSFIVDSNLTVYAKAYNKYGTSYDSLSITNVVDPKTGTGQPPVYKPDSLSVSITATPESATKLVDSAKITIDFDKKAKKKYYKIGVYSNYVEYNGPFTMKENNVIYAYAENDVAKGDSSKKIDYLTSGISQPMINVVNNTYSADISISFDKNSIWNQYKIGAGGWQDYTKPFTVDMNTTVYAKNTNELGQTSTASVKIENITSKPPVIVFDMGDYYIIKLNYPENASRDTWEYKYTEAGTWKKYKDDGILLAKPGTKILDNSVIKIKDENGKEIEFKGDAYILVGSTSDINENIFMRFEATKPISPTIVPNTTEPTKKVEIAIDYPGNLRKKQYKIVNPDGTVQTDWTAYTKPFIISKNHTTIYARSQNTSEMWSDETIYKITNIDEEPPKIKLTADLETKTRAVSILVSVTDDVKVNQVMYGNGLLGASYFENSGTSIQNNSIVTLTENGTYTFYASDMAENTQVYSLTIENIDKSAPEVTISYTPNNITTKVNVSMDFGDAVKKEYKIGASSTNWTAYTDKFDLTSDTIIANKLGNSDGTVTVCGRGTDAPGNVTTTCKKILNLDITEIKKPEITSNYGYPVISVYGVGVDGQTTIKFDTRSDITNYYSLNGTDWKVYTGTFDASSTTVVYAKSVKNDSELTVITTKSLTLPSNALGVLAYDKSNSTYERWGEYGTKTIYIDSSMQGKEFTMYHRPGNGNELYLAFYNSSNTMVKKIQMETAEYIARTYDIPSDATYMNIVNGYNFVIINEISTGYNPKISIDYVYPTMHLSSMEEGYYNVTAQFFDSNIRKMYSLDYGTTWTYYTGAVRVNLDKTVIFKGIDKNGKEYINSYTPSIPYASLLNTSFDWNTSNYDRWGTGGTKSIYIDPVMQGKRFTVVHRPGNGNELKFGFYDSNNNLLKTIQADYAEQTINKIYEIPLNTKRIDIINGYNYVQINEIFAGYYPQISYHYVYPTLYSTGMKQGYYNVTADFFQNITKKYYSLDNGTTWKNYTGTVRVELNQVIYFKGVDSNGKEYYNSFTASIPFASLLNSAFDGNYSTYDRWGTGGTKTIEIDSSMRGKKLGMYHRPGNGNELYLAFYNSSNTMVKKIQMETAEYIARTYDIPSDATYMNIVNGYNYVIITEIYPG